MAENVRGRVRGIVQDHLTGQGVEFADTATFEDLGADSLDKVELVMAWEDEFPGLSIPDNDADQFVTVGDALKFIETAVA